jgi:UDP-glucose 4-epimerase
LHIAGQSGGELSYADPVYDLQSNAQSTLLLLDLARKIKCPKILYASTVSVYGEPTEPENIRENSLTLPKSFYGVGKLASENYLRIYTEQFGIQSASLRLFNVYGPGQNLKNLKQGIVSIYLAQALTNRHIHIKGSPDRFRDLIYIDDVVDAFFTILNHSFNGAKVYNVSTGVKTTVGMLVNLLKEALPFDVTTEYAGSTPGDVFGYTGHSQKLTQETGWYPKIDLKEGTNKMVKWALEL